MQDVSCLPADPAVLAPAEKPAAKPRRVKSWLRQWCDTGFRAVIIFAVAQTWVVQGYKVYGSCMEPNLNTGERLLGSKLAMVQGLQRGDVVVFRPPHKPHTAFIKRVIGLPGEKLEIRDSRVYVNDKQLDEPYLERAWHDDRPAERIPGDMVFVMGDNRDNSNDSRAWGQLPVESIQAKAWLRYWPPERMGMIR